MDPNYTGFPNSINGFGTYFQTSIPNSNQQPNFENVFKLDVPSPEFNFMENSLFLNDLDPGGFTPPVSVSPDGQSSDASTSLNSEARSFTLPLGLSPGADSSSSDDNDFSETVLKYISQILMEENMEEKPCMFYDPLGLKNTEKSLYDALGKSYPPSPNQAPLFSESPDDVLSGSDSSHGNSAAALYIRVEPQYIGNQVESKNSLSQTYFPGKSMFQSNLQPSSQFSVNNQNSDVLVNELLAQSIFSDSESVLQFRKGVEEASKFLPGGNQLNIDLGSKVFNGNVQQEINALAAHNSDKENSPNGSRTRKNHEREDIDLDLEEGRSNKQSAVYMEESELSEMFDRVLLYEGGNEEHSLCGGNGTLEEEAHNRVQTNERPQGSNGGTGRPRGKKQGKKKDTVDLSSLLILCSQAVSTSDRRTANELLKQIRQHSTPLGDGSQRLAYYFANALEARLAGTGPGTKLSLASLASKKTSAADMLKAYQVNLSACPFKKIAIFFANKMICKASENAKSLHIIDFGILYGFQWPMLIQHLSLRPGGPPKLRITGIELPQPGFRPSERIEETGRRLEKYCERFKVPFEYHAIASQNWETIQVEDLKLDSSEVLAVNCLYRFKHLLDESVEVNGPRNAVLGLIRKINPNIFVQSIVSGSYNAPFFITRFREALFHFSALFDMFDTNILRESEERMMFEREFFGRESINVIACEGLERVERPETYKQWQARCTRAGFKQLPLNQELMEKFRSKLKNSYHKDFVLDEDSNWILQGWKGRIVYASTCWLPA